MVVVVVVAARVLPLLVPRDNRVTGGLLCVLCYELMMVAEEKDSENETFRGKGRKSATKVKQ